MGSSGFIRPHSVKLSLIHRLLDILIIWFGLVTVCRVFNIKFTLFYSMAGAIAVICFLFLSEFANYYHSWRLSRFHQKVFRLLLIWASVVLILIVIMFMTKSSAFFSRKGISTWVMLVPAMMIALELLVRLLLSSMRKHGRNTRTAVFAGAEPIAQRIQETIEAAPWMGLKVHGVYDDRAKDRVELGGLPFQGNFKDLLKDAQSGKVDYVYITLPMGAQQSIMHLVEMLSDTTVSVFIVPDFYLFDLLHSRWVNMNGIPLVSVFDTPFYGVDGWLKRFEDLVLGTIILVVVTPLMLAIGIAVKLTSSGPVIFKQRRYGLNGEVIEVWKFRSMTACDDGSVIQQATKGDQRITRLGAFLRATSLDELPQFFNVMQGSMSIVGPRPHAVAHNEEYRKLIPGYMLRHKVKPGITGWAQINGWRGETDTLDKMQKRIEFDLVYIRDWSIWFDVKIILMTLYKGFSGKNAY